MPRPSLPLRSARPMRRERVATAVGIACGYLLDELLADPARGHPVAGFGRFVSVVESRMYRDSRTAGVALVGLTAGSVLVLSSTLLRIGGGAAKCAPATVSRVVLTAGATWLALGGTSLYRVGTAVADALDADDIDAARALIPSLCGRDPVSLDRDGIARAALESIAENTSDATVGPLVWGALAGIPGLLGYRAVNTLDAMVGYRNERYRRFGWAAARLDDALNLIPARLGGMLIVAGGDRPKAAATAWKHDARGHPSPNAGVVEAAFAGALGVQLGGPTVYPHGVEHRPVLGRGRHPEPGDLRAAVGLSRRVQRLTVAVCVTGMLITARGLSRRSAG